MSTSKSSQSMADALVLFGATGDLAYKQIFPALQALVRRGALNIPIITVARSPWTREELNARIRESLEHHGGIDQQSYDKLCSLLQFIRGDYTTESSYHDLCRALGAAEFPLYYLAIPPSAFPTIINGLGKTGCVRKARVALEKPFGRSLSSARSLNATLQTIFPESSIFRIDHYLGKEPVLNLLYFRFANLLSETIFTREYVDNVQITLMENFGVEGRGKFYEETGAIRDVVQNHILQLIAILAMDSPVGKDEEAIRDEKARLLKAILPLDPDQVVRGQYRGYRDEHGVAKDSKVETFAAISLRIDTERWANVPFLIRTGKRLATHLEEIRVQFKKPLRDIYQEHPLLSSDYFRFRIGPDRSVLAFGVRVKNRGEAMAGHDEELLISDDLARDMLPYQRLLGDAIKGDPSLFGRQDAIEHQWRIVEPVLDLPSEPYFYEPGTWGPQEADRLVGAVPGGWVKPTGLSRVARAA